MADTPTSGMPDGGAIQTTDQVPVNRSGSNFRTVVGALAPLDTVTTARITNDAVTFAKMQNIATATFMGRDTAGTGDPESLNAAAAKAVLAYLASEVAFTPTGTIAATDTQAAVAEVALDASAEAQGVALGAPKISGEDELAGQMEIAVVATLPGSPDANTIYMVTT